MVGSNVGSGLAVPFRGLVAIALLATGPGRDLLGSQLLPTPSKPLAVVAMIYFAFELHHFQRRRREGGAAE
jgi:hypothetical protein